MVLQPRHVPGRDRRSARSAPRSGFPRPLVDRVAKALETYDPVMVRRDLEADGGFAEFFSTARRDPRGRCPGWPARCASRGPARRGIGRRGRAGRLSRQRRVARARGRRAAGPARAGSVAALSPWERWLELCARIDGFPRHLSIHTGGMLVTAAPLIDIAPLERATMPGPGRRPVRQAGRGDAQAHQAGPAGPRDARRDGRDTRLVEHDCRDVRGPRPAPGGDPGGLRDAPGCRHGGRLPGGEPGPDADAPEVAPELSG